MRPEDFTRQIEQFKARFDKLEAELSDPGVYAVPARASMLARERQRLENIFAVYDKWTGALKSAEENSIGTCNCNGCYCFGLDRTKVV